MALYASDVAIVTTTNTNGGGGPVNPLAVVWTPNNEAIQARFDQYPNPTYTHFAFDLLDANGAIIGGTGVQTAAQLGSQLEAVNGGYEWNFMLTGLTPATQYRCRIRVGDEPFV